MTTPNYAYYATLIKVVDGDTIDVVVDMGFRVKCDQRLRLLDVNTPERGQPGFKEATEYVRDALAGKLLVVSTVKSDSFGRYLATVWAHPDTTSVNDQLLEQGLAVPYA